MRATGANTLAAPPQRGGFYAALLGIAPRHGDIKSRRG